MIKISRTRILTKYQVLNYLKVRITIFEGTIIKNGTIVRESEILTIADDIKILKMIHGG